ncbi:hypothetical protein ACFV16_20935 [Streptomyces massasporeus]|uniref:hypothetical protein n=1 Tax=Streptomyces massasporeus TaxID=67324 RepID=UPI00367532FC
MGKCVQILLRQRNAICRTEQIGLTNFYNLVDEGAYAHIKELRAQLDIAVAKAYGWATLPAHRDEVIQRLLGMNMAISSGRQPYDPFAYLDQSARLF